MLPVHRASRPSPGALASGMCPPLPRPRQPPSAACAMGRGQGPAQSRAVGWGQPAPHAVLADVPMPQRQHQALAPDQATGADRDRSGGLQPGTGRIHADREPLIRVKAAVSTPGIPDHLGPQSMVDCRATAEWMRWRGGHTVPGAPGGRDPSPRYAWRGCHLLAPSASPSQHAARPSRARHSARPWWPAAGRSRYIQPGGRRSRCALQATGVSYGG